MSWGREGRQVGVGGGKGGLGGRGRGTEEDERVATWGGRRVEADRLLGLLAGYEFGLDKRSLG